MIGDDDDGDGDRDDGEKINNSKTLELLGAHGPSNPDSVREKQ